MNQLIKKFHVVEGFGCLDFERNINEYLCAGFEPHGNLVVIETKFGFHFFQAMKQLKTFKEITEEAEKNK